MAGGANTILPGYLTYIGDKLEIIFDHNGPTSYSNIGTSAGTGDVVNASDLGIGGIESVNCDGLDSTNAYYVFAQYTGGGNGNAVAKIALRWFQVSNNAEVANGTNLSASTIRVQLRGV